MAVVEKSALVLHSAEEMFRLVYNVDDYQNFLPWCRSSRLVSEDRDACQICGEIEVARAGVVQSFTTCNSYVENESMHIDLLEGPFRHLHGHWTFTPLRDNACKIELRLEFEFSGKLMNMAFGAVFAQIANSMVESFCKRAGEVYGGKQPHTC